MDSGRPLREELSTFLTDLLSLEIKNQEEYVNSITKWQQLYKGNKDPKSWPFESCANVSIPIIRSGVDTIFVRDIDNIFNKQKVWIVNAKKDEYIDFAKQIEDGLDWFQREVIGLRSKLMSPLLQAIKIGTGVGKLVYEEKKKVIYLYNESGKGAKVKKVIKSKYKGPNFYPISREDWIQSSDSLDINECMMCGFRFYLRSNRVRLKAKQGLFFSDSVAKLLGDKTSDTGAESGDMDEVKEERARQEHRELKFTEESKGIPFWELHVKYDVDEDGEEDDIVVTFNKESGIIMDAIYQPLFGNFRPFKKFIFYPVEYSSDGEGVCQINQSIQEEIDTIHNQRIDRVTQINCPVFFVKAGSGLEKLKRITPGKVYVVDEDVETAIKEFRFSDVTFSSFKEEEQLIAMADRAIGISPGVLGMSTAERPVAKVEGLLLEETNKKFKYGQDNIREQIRSLGFDLLDFLAQYQPRFTYYTKGKSEIPVEQTVDFPTEDLREIIDIQLATSSEVMNQQARQQANLVLYQLLSDYMTKIAGMGQALTSPQVPSEFKKLLSAAGDISSKVITRIVDDFPTVPDSSSVVLDLNKAVDVNKCIQESVDLMPAQPMPGPEMPQPQGQPGMPQIPSGQGIPPR
jgi:hypothetical protein